MSAYTYATSDMSIADITPTTGVVCGGTWNRNSGGGVPDYTICSPPAAGNTKSVAYVTASAAGTTSNPIAVYIHPVVTSIAITTPLATAACSTDPNGPTSNCCPQALTSVVTAPAYDGSSCISQDQSRQIAARVYANGTTTAANNITCQVGHLTFAPQGSSNIVTIDANGVATANQPGSVLITATVANSSSASSAGFFSTCPPASIVLAPVNVTPVNGAINISLNSSQALTASVLDTNGVTLTGLSLTFDSTNPQTIAASGGSVLATYPGTATITAACQPPTCNPAPFSQIGLFGNGKPVTSNGPDRNRQWQRFERPLHRQHQLPIPPSRRLHHQHSRLAHQAALHAKLHGHQPGWLDPVPRQHAGHHDRQRRQQLRHRG